MKKQKMPKDINELAAKIVALATGQEKPDPEETPEEEEPKKKKNKKSKS